MAALRMKNRDYERNHVLQSLTELESQSPGEFQLVTSSAVSFLNHFDLPHDSYVSLKTLGYLIRHKTNYLKKDHYLNLMNDVYFHVHRTLGFKLPESFVELKYLAESGYDLRFIERPYYRNLAHRWMHDVLSHLRSALTAEELDVSCLDLILKCLIGLPKEGKLSAWSTDFHDHQTSM